MSLLGPTETKERRVGERTRIRCAVEVELGDSTVRGQVINVSATGALLVVTCDVKLGVELTLRLELPDDQPPAQVNALAIRKSGENPVQLGVTFILPPAETVARIRALIYDASNPLL